MTRILLLHGPNLNRLGRRDPRQYGTITLPELEALVRDRGRAFGFEVGCFQSNHEGALVDRLQEETGKAAGCLFNPGALAHQSYVLHDAILDFGGPVVEVHLSRVSGREPWRRRSVTRPACAAFVEGEGPAGYVRALGLLAALLGRAPEREPGAPGGRPRH